MVSEKERIVVIETGSATVSGAVGYKCPDGTLEVEAFASEPSGDFIKNGVVRNIDRTAQCLTNIINMLEGTLKNATIDKVYIGIGGYTLHSIHGRVERGFDEETRVTAEMVDNMFSDNEERIISDKTVIEVIPQEYFVDSLLTAEPVGCNCRHIVGEYLNLMARFSTIDNLRSAFDMAKLENTDTLITPVRLADAILTPTERSLGCTLVDIGAGSTTISIYKGGRLRFLSVVPLGDSLITADLASLGIGDEEAERIKRTIGFTRADDEKAVYITEGGNEIPRANIGLVIRARMQEILANVACQVKASGYTDDKLSSGYIFTGGALEIPGAEAYTAHAFTRIRVAGPDVRIHWTPTDKPSTSKQLVLGALIAAGDENCVTITRPATVEIDYSNPELTTGSLFGEDGEDAQIERDRKQAERQKADAERKRQEKEEKRRKKEEERAARPKRKSLFDRIKEMRDNLTDLINDNE